MIELKSGETFNGTLTNCDTYMNINLKDVIITSKDGSKFLQVKECHIRGAQIKYLRIPDSILENVVLKQEQYEKRNSGMGGGRGRGQNVRGTAQQQDYRGNRNTSRGGGNASRGGKAAGRGLIFLQFFNQICNFF